GQVPRLPGKLCVRRGVIVQRAGGAVGKTLRRFVEQGAERHVRVGEASRHGWRVGPEPIALPARRRTGSVSWEVHGLLLKASAGDGRGLRCEAEERMLWPKFRALELNSAPISF